MSHAQDLHLDGDLAARAREVTWLLLDVDGVLTDGRLLYGPDGSVLKPFNPKDGLGIKLAMQEGLKVGLLTGRKDAGVARRAEELGLDEVISGRSDKRPAFADFLDRNHLEARQVAYVGDDLTDLPVLARCGLGFAPADAVAEVKARAHRVLRQPGGRGAVREAVELLLRARGRWEDIIAAFLVEEQPLEDA